MSLTTTIGEADRAKLETLRTAYGDDALLLWLVTCYERRAATGDRVAGAILRDFANELRACVRRRDESSQLASYRRDWQTQDWQALLAVIAQRDGLRFNRQRVEALRKYGCPPAKCGVVSAEYAANCGLAVKASAPNLIPAGDNGWLLKVAARKAELAGATTRDDLAFWLIENGFSGTPTDAERWLRHNRDGLPTELQRLVPKPRRRAAAAAETKKVETDVEDESVFGPLAE